MSLKRNPPHTFSGTDKARSANHQQVGSHLRARLLGNKGGKEKEGDCGKEMEVVAQEKK